VHEGRNSAGPQDIVEAERLESSFAEPNLVVLAESKVTTRQQGSLGAKEAQSLEGDIGRSIGSTLGEVILLSLHYWGCPVWNPLCS